MRLTLQETDYGNFLAAEASLDPKLIAQRATEKWVKEFKYFRATATGNLARFMDYVAYEYMIDNILDLIKAATSGGGGGGALDVEELVANCHPLGKLEDSVMKSILAFENLGEDFTALYRTVLVDTPVGKYFTMFLKEVAEEKAAADMDHVRSTFAEMPMPIIEASIKKHYLEDFYRFCADDCGGETATVMCELLATRADVLAVNITMNSLNTDLSLASTRTTRESLFPCIGHLYPEGSARLAKAEDDEAVGKALQDCYPEYFALWSAAPSDARGHKDLSQVFFGQTVRQLELAFDGQFHYGPFYAYAKLKEQEVKNVQWIATCLELRMYGEADRIIPIFPRGPRGGAGAGR